MKNLGVLFFKALIFLSILSCGKDKEEVSIYYDDCVFVQDDETMDGIVDDDEIAKMQECIDNQYTDRSLIENNLIGRWELVGHGEGWVQSISQPCANILFEESTLTFSITNGYIDTTYQLTWEIVENEFGFTLDTYPLNTYELGITNFSPNYMFFDERPSDGNMYIYQKL